MCQISQLNFHRGVFFIDATFQIESIAAIGGESNEIVELAGHCTEKRKFLLFSMVFHKRIPKQMQDLLQQGERTRRVSLHTQVLMIRHVEYSIALPGQMSRNSDCHFGLKGVTLVSDRSLSGY